ncbi:hypothetical protein [Cupriavidus necator]
MIVLLVVIGAVGAFVALNPFMPEAHLDSSWMLSLNEAIANGLVFGRDLIFTFGPFGSIYTKQFHPATDALVLGGGLLLALSFALGILSLARKGRWGYAALVPLILTQLTLPDSLFLSLPLLFVLLTAELVGEREGTVLTKVTLLTLLLALTLLPLIKGTFAGISVVALGLGCLVVLPWRKRIAVLGLSIFMLAITGFWVLAQQPLKALPGFFVAQSPIISGYTEAMAYDGNGAEVWLYLGAAFALAVFFYVGYARERKWAGWMALAGVVATLFFAFKAGFVRHDAHAFGAAGVLILVALQIALIASPRLGLSALAVGLYCGFAIAANYVSLRPQDSYVRALAFYKGMAFGLEKRLPGAGTLDQEFLASLEKIRKETRLPDVKGSTDIYPIDQSALLAHHFQWAPRPVIQSYSAYNGELASKNAAHLKGSGAPKNVFFRVAPLDARMPALDDGLSWPLLLAQYSFVSFNGNMALLSRTAKDARPEMPGRRMLMDSIFPLGSEVALPSTVGPLWVELVVEPKLLGKLMFVLYKPTGLRIQLTLEDGRRVSYRYISAVGKSGFLLSPLVENTRDFIALASRYRSEYFLGRRPVAMAIVDESGSKLVWGDTLAMKIWALELPNQQGVESLFLDAVRAEPPGQLPNASPDATAECSIDSVNNRRAGPVRLPVQGLLKVNGWGIVSKRDGVAPESVVLKLSGEGGSTYYIPAPRMERRDDVKRAFKLPGLGDTGFSVMADVSRLTGGFSLSVLQVSQGRVFGCQTRQLIDIPAARN